MFCALTASSFKMFFDGLSPELQAILKEEAVKAQNLTRERISHGEAAVVEELKKKHLPAEH